MERPGSRPCFSSSLFFIKPDLRENLGQSLLSARSLSFSTQSVSLLPPFPPSECSSQNCFPRAASDPPPFCSRSLKQDEGRSGFCMFISFPPPPCRYGVVGLFPGKRPSPLVPALRRAAGHVLQRRAADLPRVIFVTFLSFSPPLKHLLFLLIQHGVLGGEEHKDFSFFFSPCRREDLLISLTKTSQPRYLFSARAQASGTSLFLSASRVAPFSARL